MAHDPHVPPTLGELAVRATVAGARTDIGEVEALLRADATVPGVVTVVDQQTYLIDRAYLELVLAGRLGYGRALHHRRALRGIVRAPALVLPAATGWDEAARAAMARSDLHKAEPLVVAYDDSGLGVAPVAPLVEYLSRRYADLAHTDELTGLGNRRLLVERGTALGRHATLVVLDLNRFKEINDVLGHEHGDALLRHVGAALARAVGAHRAFRLGGDEFVVLMEHGTPVEPREFGQWLAAAVAGPYQVAGIPLTAEASVGVAGIGGPAHDLDTLLTAADTAMYAAKRDRIGVEVWHPQLSAARAADLGLHSELRSAIEAGQLVAHYQPLVDARTRRTVSLEALVRWNHPQRGLLPPGVFLPQAERSDVIHALTAAVLADAVRQAARWHERGRTVPVAVNLAAPVLASDRVVATVTDLLAQTGLPAYALIVEVTESAVMTRPEEAARRLHLLRDLGVRIAMDDFGTGFTSLELLTRLPLDELKLDRAFVTRVHGRERPIVEAVARMAAGLGLTLVAEGVEDERTADTLTGLGFDLLQGYHFSRPVPAGQLEEKLFDACNLAGEGFVVRV